MRFVRVASMAELEGKKIIEVDAEGARIIIARTSQGLRAVDAICTHEYAELIRGMVVDDTIICPLHFSRFSLLTGEVESPPADAPLRTYPLKVEGSDIMVGV